MEYRLLLERKKQEIMRVLKGGQELGVGSVLHSELVGEIQKTRKQNSDASPASATEEQSTANAGGTLQVS